MRGWKGEDGDTKTVVNFGCDDFLCFAAYPLLRLWLPHLKVPLFFFL